MMNRVNSRIRMEAKELRVSWVVQVFKAANWRRLGERESGLKGGGLT
jgi:NADH:ubiquinone oxidoreductase subunit C